VTPFSFRWSSRAAVCSRVCCPLVSDSDHIKNALADPQPGKTRKGHARCAARVRAAVYASLSTMNGSCFRGRGALGANRSESADTLGMMMTACTEMSGRRIRRQAGRYRMSNPNTDRIDSTTPFDPRSWECQEAGAIAPRVVVAFLF
jgi:hypothetical protein